MAVRTVAPASLSTPSHLEEQPLLVNADQTTQKTVQQILVQQGINGFITGSITTGITGTLLATAFIQEGMTDGRIFLPAIFSSVFGGGIAGSVSRVTLRILKNTTSSWVGRGVLGLLGGALWGASAGSGISFLIIGNPFAAGASTGLFLTPIISLGGGVSLILGGISARSEGLFSAFSLSLATGSLVGLGIGGGLGAAVGLAGEGASLGSIVGSFGTLAIFNNCCFGCQCCGRLREVDPPAKK